MKKNLTILTLALGLINYASLANDTETKFTTPGLFAQSKQVGKYSVGPFLLRESSDDWLPITPEINFDSKSYKDSLLDVVGASFSFPDGNIFDAVDSLNTKGAIMYPISWDHEPNEKSYFLYSIAPTIEWSYKYDIDDPSKRLEELSFKIPFITQFDFFQSGGGNNLTFRATPSYLTDFSLRGGQIGFDISIEPMLDLPDSLGKFVIGDWSNLYNSKIAYKFSTIPFLSYTKITSESVHITGSKGDSNLWVGMKNSFDVKPFGKDSKWKLGIGYDFKSSLSGGDDWRALFSANATYEISKYISISVKYENGESLASGKPVDSFDIGPKIKW